MRFVPGSLHVIFSALATPVTVRHENKTPVKRIIINERMSGLCFLKVR
jgi:hypothetical protein